MGPVCPGISGEEEDWSVLTIFEERATDDQLLSHCIGKQT